MPFKVLKAAQVFPGWRVIPSGVRLGTETNATVHRCFAVFAVFNVGLTLSNSVRVVEVELGVNMDLSARSSTESYFR